MTRDKWKGLKGSEMSYKCRRPRNRLYEKGDEAFDQVKIGSLEVYITMKRSFEKGLIWPIKTQRKDYEKSGTFMCQNRHMVNVRQRQCSDI